MHASATATTGTDSAAVYTRFRAAVAQAQVTHWLASLNSSAARSTIIDISGPCTNAAEMAVDHGHRVIRVRPVFPKGGSAPFSNPPDRGATRPPGPPGGGRANHAAPRREASPSLGRMIVGEQCNLEFLADGCADGVIAEDGTLSRNVGAESLVGEIARVLRPGGRVLACVDSQTRGMAALAQQNAWPNLADLPRADVLLVPWPDGTITRCYGSGQLRELFTAAGFEVNWIRPRTVFAPRAVSYLLTRDPGGFARLLSAELRANSDDSVGDQLVISARKRP